MIDLIREDLEQVGIVPDLFFGEEEIPKAFENAVKLIMQAQIINIILHAIEHSLDLKQSQTLKINSG